MLCGIGENWVVLIAVSWAKVWIFCDHREFAWTFFDDIIVFSKSEEESKGFESLKENMLVINRKTSNFFMEEIHFLGHIKDGVCMDPAKIRGNQELGLIWIQFMMFVVFSDYALITSVTSACLEREFHQCMNWLGSCRLKVLQDQVLYFQTCTILQQDGMLLLMRVRTLQIYEEELLAVIHALSSWNLGLILQFTRTIRVCAIFLRKLSF